jgi:hypothetical protein
MTKLLQTIVRLFCLFIFALGITGCVHHEPREIAGQRTNAQGVVVQKIVRAPSYVNHSAFTPDGGREYRVYTCKYYSQETGKPERQFEIGNRKTIPLLNDFLAVSNSTLWVTSWQQVGSPDGSTLHIYVFDDKGFYVEHAFTALPTGVRQYPLEADIKFENGNQTIAFNSPTGQKQYNVLTDTLADVK